MIDDLVKHLKNHSCIGVFSHVHPDGDAIGSQIAMCIWLQHHAIKAYAFNDDPVPFNVSWLSEFYMIQKPERELVDQCDAFLFLDGNISSRFGIYGDYTKESGKPCYLIDHHPNPGTYFVDSYSVDTASSSGELVYDIYERSKSLDMIDKDVAISLYAAIMTDTGSFRFDSVTPRVHEIVADLIRRGKFQPNEIHESIFDRRTINQMKLLGKTLDSISLHVNNQIGSIAVTQKMLEETGCTYDDTEGLISYPLSIDGIKAAVLFCELNNKIKLSLRTKKELDANRWARKFGGGGHHRAAGAWHPGPMKQAVKDVIEEAARQLETVKF